MARSLIICPTFDHVETVFAAIFSVQAQKDGDWELVVIGDGAPPRTGEIVKAFSSNDSRIRYLENPKGEGHGEAYRDTVVRQSSAEFVCHLGDDDIWSDRHLEAMTGMLTNADFAMQGVLKLDPNGRSQWRFANLGVRTLRDWSVAGPPLMIQAGLNNVAVRRSAYLKLPIGWQPAPAGHPSDTNMWKRYLAAPAMRVAASCETTFLKFPGGGVRGRSTGTERLAELTPWLARINRPGLLDSLRRASGLPGPLLAAMAVAGSGDCATLEAALGAAGLRPVGTDEACDTVIDGKLMPVPMTEAQLRMCEVSWTVLRGPDRAPSDYVALRNLDRDLTRNLLVQLEALGRLVPDIALRIENDLEEEPGLRRLAARARLRRLSRAGNESALAAEVSRLSVEMPGAGFLKAWQNRLT